MNRDTTVQTRLGPLLDLVLAAGWELWVETVEPFVGGDDVAKIGIGTLDDGSFDDTARMTVRLESFSAAPAEPVKVALLRPPS